MTKQTTTSALTVATATSIIKNTKRDYICKRVAKKLSEKLANVRDMYDNQSFPASVKKFILKCADRYENARELANCSETEIVHPNPVQPVTVENAIVDTDEKIVEITVEPVNELETKPVKTMLERMRETIADRLPRVEISKLYKSKCKSEIIFFRDNRKMFEPTDDEITVMREIAARVFENLPTNNKLNEPCDYVHASPESALTLQYDAKTSKPKSAFFIADEMSYQIAVRFSA